MSESAKKIDAAFNDLRRKVDYIEESCRWQNAAMKKILQMLQGEPDSSDQKSEDRND